MYGRNNSVVSIASSSGSTLTMSQLDEEDLKSDNSSQNSSQSGQNGENHPRGNLMSMVHHKWRKMWRRDSAEITPTDPSYKSVYLGNVVTTWAKGEGCLDRPASALWKNHCQGRGSIKMCISVAPSGLKAQTREHGLTEYWANRLTWCGVPPDYPKLFCWIYRHEGRKLKQELRCHAVMCGKEYQAQRLASSLKNRLTEALFDFKKEKILRQNARLSIVQSLYNTSATKRKLVLMNSNSQNYKPPLERSKSAPKLSCIEEFSEEEENYEEFMTIPESDEMEVPVPHPLTNGDLRLESPTPVPVAEEKENRVNFQDFETESSPETIPASPAKPEEVPSVSPIRSRKSFSHPSVTHHPEGSSRRPHTVPMDAKLNLPYMTGYDKVMQLLDMPRDSHQLELLLGEDQDDDEFFTGHNSDPLASSPGSDASVDSSCEEEYGKIRSQGRRRRRSLKTEETAEDCEINDNVSDESGYSEEAPSRRNNKKQGELNLDPSGSPDGGSPNGGSSPQPLRKKSTNTNTNNEFNKKKSTTIIIGGGNEPVIYDSASSKIIYRSELMNGDNNSTLVVYDNLCFEI